MQEQYPLISSKIQVPNRPATLLRRERLIGYLHSNIYHKVILISAGAGYGKTSLVVDYAHDTELPVCWYALDTNDNHVFTFIEYLVASIRRRFPEFGEPVLRALRSFRGRTEDVEPFVRLIIDEIERHISDYFVIVLDDYHEVLESEPVNALVDGLLRYLPEQCHLIIASRAIPRRLTLTRLAAREEIVGIGVNHLRFTRDEIQQVLALRGITDLDEERLNALAERSEGWITAILLAAQSHWTDSIQQIIEISSTGALFDYLAREVLDQQPPEVQEFLLKTSVLREMSPPLCDALLGIDHSARILRSLAEQGLFTFEISSASGWYQYHQLFREFLVHKLEIERPIQYRELCLKEALIMANQGHWSWAINSFLEAEAYDQAADALEIIVQDFFNSGHFDELSQWIDALPEDVLNAHPRLLLFRAQINTRRAFYKEAQSLLEHAHRLYRERGSIVGMAQALLQQGIIARMTDQFEPAVNLCRRVLEMIDEKEDPLSVIRARQNLGICYQMLGEPERAQEEMQRALELAEKLGDTVDAAAIAHDIGTRYHLLGQMEEARQYLHRALMHWRKIGNPADLAMTLQGLGVIHHHMGQYAEAQNRYEESLEKARQIGNARLEAYALLNIGDLFRDQGRIREALERYEKALELAASRGQPFLTLYVMASMGEAYRLGKEPTRARQILMEALDYGEQAGLEEPLGLVHLTLGALATQEKQFSEATDHLEQAQRLLEKAGARREIARVHLQKALLARQRSDPYALREHLTTLGEWVIRLGTDQFIVAEGTGIIKLLPYISEWNITGLDALRLRTQIEELFPTITLEPRLRLIHEEADLELLALDGSQVIYQGRIVRDFESSVARVMAFLLAEYPAGLPKERICDMLWPETTQAKGESLFHSTIYRLRRAICKEAVIQIDGIYRLNPALTIWYDVAEFRRLARLGFSDSESGHIARMNAIDLYRNSFLEAHDYRWCDEVRYELQHEMIRLLTEEAFYTATHIGPQEAETLFLRILALDELDERAHRGVMWCRAKMGDIPGAVRHYRESVRVLQTEMGIPPRSDTQRMFELIHQGEIPPTPF